MNNSIDRITLDVHSAVSQVTLYWKRGDTARTIEATLNDNGKPWVLDGCTVSFTALTDDPLLHYCEIRDNRIIYEAAPIVTETVRSILCEFRVVGMGDRVLTTPRFTIEVRDTVIDPLVVEETEQGNIGTLDALISDATELIGNVTQKLEDGEFKGDPFEYEDFTPEQLEGLIGPVGPAGNGIASITHTGVRNAVNPNFPNVPDGTLVSDVYTITYTDSGTFELVIPRGSRIFTGGYDGVGESIGKDDGIVLNVTALQGDYYISVVTGHMWRKASDADQAWEYITTLGGGNFDMAADASTYPGVTKLQVSDGFILYDLPAGTMSKISWSSFRTIIKDYLDGNITSNGVTDTEGSGFIATTRELDDDTTLLTELDIPRIVEAVIAELNK